MTLTYSSLILEGDESGHKKKSTLEKVDTKKKKKDVSSKLEEEKLSRQQGEGRKILNILYLCLFKNASLLSDYCYR